MVDISQLRVKLCVWLNGSEAACGRSKFFHELKFKMKFHMKFQISLCVCSQNFSALPVHSEVI